MGTNLERALGEAVQAVIRAEIETITSEEIAAAQARVEKRVKEKIGEIAVRVSANYDVVRDGRDLIIRVRSDEAAG